MDSFHEFVELLNYAVWSFGIPVGGETIPLVVLALLGPGLFLTIRLGLVQFRRFGHGVKVASGRYDDPDDPGDVSHFQALTTALSATVGIGNIAGVAIAIHWGGPGALFWMWMTAILGMATKFGEVTLAQRYRRIDASAEHELGTVAGGPMYYIERGLGPRWRPLAIAFAIMLGLTAFLTGNGIQANTIADTMQSAFSLQPAVTGSVSAAIVAAVILGGITRIGRVTGFLAPAMALIYVTGALVIIVLNIEKLLPTFELIFREAFNPTSGVAGTGAGALLVTMMWGVKRGLYSNEAGQGSAPIAHAAAKTDEPVSEGVVALLEPFIDTIVICTMTALVIVMTGVWKEPVPTPIDPRAADMGWLVERDGAFESVEGPGVVEVEGGEVQGSSKLARNDVPIQRLYVDEACTRPFDGTIVFGEELSIRDREGSDVVLWGKTVETGAPLTMLAFRRGLAPIGDVGHYVVLVSVMLFGVSTAISWSYYGDRCAQYVLGPKAVLPYRAVFVLMHFAGAVVPLSLAWAFGDAFLGLVIIPNLIALILLTPQIRELTDSYFRRRPWRR